MFIQLPNSKAVFDTTNVRLVVLWSEGRWKLTINVGSKLQTELRDIYINNIDYDYLWAQLQSNKTC